MTCNYAVFSAKRLEIIMNYKRKLSFIAALLLCFSVSLCGCKDSASEGSSVKDLTSVSDSSESPDKPDVITRPADKEYEFTDNSPVFSLEESFYSSDISVELKTQSDAEIYYTDDGSEPDKTKTLYSEPILIKSKKSYFPKANVIKAKAYYSDGTESATTVHTYFVNKNIENSFSGYVFSVSGESSALTDSPDGIFYGKNYEQRGRESEREVHLSAWDKDGNQILGQYCGVRIYGAASRESSVKSMKFFARKSYSSGKGSFKTDLFQTPVSESDGEVIDKYDKLVLRNSGNDFQFAFIRDELCQVLAMQAGFNEYEAVVPAVCYLNGEYYGYFWLHESYCDDYFKEKFPSENAQGEFVVLEGTDQMKKVEEDDEDSVYAKEFNELYDKYSAADLTDDAVYNELKSVLDVESYLDYFAFNIYINNWDWPQNNFRCYRYCPADGEASGSGIYDGKWRFLLHDMDYSMGMYDQDKVMANYNNLSHILKEGDERYSPLFAALFEREDCRTYFRDKIYELADGALDGENIKKVCSELHEMRSAEQERFYEHLSNLRAHGDQSVWCNQGHMKEQLDKIYNFANTREKYILQYTDECLEKYE